MEPDEIDWFTALSSRSGLFGVWRSKWTRGWMRLMLVALSVVVAFFGVMWITRQKDLAQVQSPAHLTHLIPWAHPSIWDWTFGITLIIGGIMTAVWSLFRFFCFFAENFDPS